jgi:hypothetical protein
MSPRFDIGSFSAAVAGIAAALSLDIIVVAARFYVRGKLKQNLGLHDWLVLPALVRNYYTSDTQGTYTTTVSEHWYGSRYLLWSAERLPLQSVRHDPAGAAIGGQNTRGL